jgi:CheY-like chemotaxis protein
MTASDPSELRLLVVEDDPIIAMELEDELSDLGHHVLAVAGTVKQALRLVRELAEQIDAVILDANLGGDSSFPVADALRERRIRYVVASGYEAKDLRARGFEGPIIGKPYRGEQIQAALVSLSE